MKKQHKRKKGIVRKVARVIFLLKATEKVANAVGKVYSFVPKFEKIENINENQFVKTVMKSFDRTA